MIKYNRKGRAVHADRDYRPGDLIESCPVLVIKDKDFRKTSILGYYVFEWAKGSSAIPTGNGLLYNHSGHPNADYFFHLAWKRIIFRAHRFIRAGQEITINYEGDPDCPTKPEFCRRGDRVSGRRKKAKR